MRSFAFPAALGRLFRGFDFARGGPGRPPAWSAAVVLALAASALNAAPLAWNPAPALSVTAGNPNGPWSYGYADTGFTTFTPFTSSRTTGTGFLQWYGWAADFTPCVAYNGQTTAVNGVPPGYLLLHPGDGNQPAVLRWTAPVGGAVRVAGHFHAGDGGVMQVAVRRNSTVLWSATDAGAFDLVTTIAVGDRIDFAVYGAYFSGSTGLLATITSEVVSVPLTTASTNKLSLGAFAGGAVVQIDASGSGEIAPGQWATKPDGSLVSAASSPFTYNNPGATYTSVATFPSGDGVNRFPGGGSNYDYNGTGWVFAGKQTTDTTDPAAIRFGALVGTFAATPGRNDWFYIGYGGLFTVPAGGATLYIAVNESTNASANNTGAYAVTARVVTPGTLALPLTTDAAGKIALGPFPGGAVVRLAATGSGDLVNSTYQTYPDGSLAATASGSYTFANAGATFPAVAGGDGLNHFVGGGSNYDHSGSAYGFAGTQTTDTTNAGAIRAGAVVGTFAASPGRADWFLVGKGGAFTVPAGGATVYLAVNDSFSSDNHGSYALTYAVTLPGGFSLPLATNAPKKISAGTFAGGALVRVTAAGTGDLVDSRLQTNPDGSLAAAAGSPWTYANANASYPGVSGFPAGDGTNHFAGGGLNYDGTNWGFAGTQTTDTADATAIRMGAVVGTFSASPARADWFLVGYGRTVTVPTGGATLYLAVNESVVSNSGDDNHGAYTVTTAEVAAANDLFGDAATLAGASASATAVSADATKEAGEPNHAGNAGGKSLWWKWTAPKTGVVALSTIGSTFDTLLAVYTGTAVGSLTVVASDDNSGPANTSKLTFNATAGTTYRIAVDGSSGASGSVQLNLDYAFYFHTLAGAAGVSGTTDATGAAARFNHPITLALDGSGNLVAGDYNNGTIRKIAPTTAVTTFASGLGEPDGVAFDTSGNLFVAGHGTNVLYKITAGGTVSTFATGFNFPNGLAIDASNVLFVADAGSGKVKKVSPAGAVSDFASGFVVPTGVALDAVGNVFVVDENNHVIRKVTPDGATTTVFAGQVGVAGSADGLGGAARFNFPSRARFDSAGNLIVTDRDNHTVRKITPGGLVTTIGGLAATQGTADGTGGAARFFAPHGLALDASGALYVADFGNHTIRKAVPAYAPEVTSVSPASVAVGGTVTLAGAYFAGATEVRFNGVAATSFTVVSPTSLNAVFPAGATAGPVTVVGPGGTSAATVNVSPVNPPTVALTSESGTGYSAAAGTASIRVRITYTGQTPSAIGVTLQLPAGWTFASYTGPNALTAPSVGDNFLEWAFSSFPANELTFVLTADYPAGQSGNKAVTGAVNYRPGNLNLTLPTLAFGLTPVVASLSATNLFSGASVTLTGTGFTGASAVRFNNVDAASFTVVNDTTITAVAPAALTSGAVTVVGAGGTSNATVVYSAVQPAPSALDGFDPRAGGGNANVTPVLAAVVQPDGKIVIGGKFTTLQPAGTAAAVTANRIARLNRDGTIDAGFTASASSDVNALARQADGKILVGAGGTLSGSSTTGLARLNADGTRDGTFTFGSSGTVYRIVVLSDGKILAVGAFISGSTRYPILRLLADGSLDPSFTLVPVTGVLSATLTWAYDVAVLGDGRLLLGGYFWTIGGQGIHLLARLNADGTLDATFDAGLTHNNGPQVNRVLVQPDGKILIAGRFTSVAGQSWAHFARLNANGTLDPTFAALSGSGGMSDFVLQPDGRIVVCGGFSTLNGQPRNSLARLWPDGSVDASFVTGVADPINEGISVLVGQPDGGVLVGGGFSTLGGLSRGRIARLQPDGAVERALIADTDGTIEVAVRQPDGKTLIGGAFGTVGGVVRTNLARLNADNTVDTTFANVAPLGVVRAIVVQPDGRIVIGGGFSTLTGLSVNRIGVARLTAAGAIDAGFAADLNFGASVNALLLQPDGKLVVGGAFTAAGTSARSNVLRLNADGSLDAGFNPGANNSVTALALQADGAVVLGGTFTNAGGASRGRLARVDASGTLDSGFNPGANGTPRAIVVQADGRILVGGSFTAIANNAANNVARLNSAGGFDGGFAATTNQPVNTLALAANGRLVIGGAFTTVTNLTDTPRDYVALVDSTGGTVDPLFNVYANGAVNTASFGPDGKLALGGGFTSLGGEARARLARLVALTPTETKLTATATTVTLVRTGPVPELAWVTVEKSNDGATWTALGNAARVAGTANWQLTGQAIPDNTLLYLRARAAAPVAGYGSSSLVEHVQQIFLGVAPVVASVTPATVAPGMGVTITGANFTGATAVTFGGVPAPQFQVLSATQIRAVVPAGALAGAVVVTTGGGASAGGVTANVPVHRYAFNGSTVTDSAGSDHGTLLGGATLSGGRLVLDGVDDSVEFATKLVPAGGPFTVALFAQQQSAQATIVELISQGQTGTTGFYLGHDAARGIRAGDSWAVTGVPFPSDGALHHYALVNETNNARLYIDGVLVASKGSPLALATTGDVTRLGRQFSPANEYFHGSLDELWIFNGALAAGEIAQLAVAVPQRLTIKSDATTLASATDDFSRLDSGNAAGLTFGAATVGALGTGSPVPPGAPSGTSVLNVTAGGGASGLFKATFALPAVFSAPAIAGAANMDDTGRAFLNGNPLSPGISSGQAGVISHSGNATFAAANAAWFVPGVNEFLVSDLNSGGGPSGGSFFAQVDYLAPNAPPIISDFATGASGWTVASLSALTSNNYSVVGTYAPTYTATGGNPGGFISSTDPDGGDFMFSAPAAFLGNKSAYVGGTLSYDLNHPVGAVDYQATDVVLAGNGTRLIWQASPAIVPPASGWMTVTVPLAPSAQWRLGTNDGPLATASDFQTVLGNLTAVYLRGEYTFGAETTGLDNVILASPVTPPAILTHPVPATVVAGASTAFSVSATGVNLTYQWTKNGTPIVGATNASLSVANAALASIGDYAATVSNAAGSVTSRLAGLFVTGLTDPTASLVVNGPALYAAAGGSVSFTATIFHPTAPTALGFTVVTPAGWTYAGGTGEPGVKPVAGDTGALGWAFFSGFGAGSSTFTFTLNYPAAPTGGDIVVRASAEFRTPTTALVVPSVTLLRSTVLPVSITTQPAAVAVDLGQPAAFAVVATGDAPITYQWRRNGTALPGATNATYTIASTTLTDAGSFDVEVTNPAGTVRSQAAQLSIKPTLITPVIAAQAVPIGGSLTLSVSVNAVPAPTFAWRLNGVPIAGATNPTYSLSGATAAQAGDYTVVITNAGGTLTAGPLHLDVLTRDLLAASTRTLVPAGGSVASGFTIEGTVPKTILLRGLGPTLAGLGESNPLADPKLTLLDGSYAVIATNDDWGTNANAAAITSAGAAVTAFALPAGSKDAALLLTLGPGTYTAVLESVDGAGGTGLVEIYDADTGNQLRIVMLTARGPVGAGAAVHVTGFVVGGAGQKKFLFRALGESLGESNGLLVDPVLAVYQGTTQLGEDDDWDSTTEINTAVGAAGLRALGPTLDSTLLLSLAPGTYTASIRGFGNSIGETFLELAQIDAGRPATIAPAITYLVANQQAIVGTTAFFGVNVLAKPAPTYQWRRNGTPLADGGRIAGATSPVLRISAAEAADAASYDVIITPGTVTTGTAGAPPVAAVAVPGLTSPARTLTILPEFHAADVNKDRAIDLLEITRVLQLFAYTAGGVRTGEYHTQAGTEDGYAAGPGAIASYHSADANRDGRLSVTELSRVILLYNYVNSGVRTGQYHAAVGTEDGFAPGPVVRNDD
ncbi:MAG: IPT/TIG domain-containing protein [Verrucomicrobia bacterium]|nr:IPT/TIG domain-containing protein [Verrucomicrobiota bacterium]